MVANDAYPSIVNVLAKSDVPPEPDNAGNDTQEYMPGMPNIQKVNLQIRVKSLLATISQFG